MEIFYLAFNRREFTRTSLEALLQNTDFSQVQTVVLYDDSSTDGASDVLHDMAGRFPVPTIIKRVNFGSPVAAMNDYIITRRPDLFAKIDSDTMVPPGWLDDCLNVMDRHPWLDLLGIEAMVNPQRPIAECPKPGRGVDEAEYIGGIGLMRGRAFQYSLPRPDGRMGFTAWQSHHPATRKGWLNPALPVFLLDRMPTEPWASWSAEYVAKGWQRPWEQYTPNMSRQWEWFTK